MDFMAKRPDRDQNDDKARNYEDRHHHPHGTGYGTERSAYDEYLSRRWQGSALPTAQDYARAIRVWRQLPGAIMAAAADLGPIGVIASARHEPDPLGK